MKKSAAFTLAEVLITLGKIGVVAAMTIPTLIANIKGARIRTQLKKGISTLNQAARLNLANNDWDFGTVNYSDPTMKMTTLLDENLSGKTFLGNYEYDRNKHGYVIKSFEDEVTWNDFLGSSAWYILYQLSDGMIIGMTQTPQDCTIESYRKDKNAYGLRCSGFIDVNGKQLPNSLIECSNPDDTKPIWSDNYKECTVKITGNTGDIFPIMFYDSTVVPSSNAGKYILNTSK